MSRLVVVLTLIGFLLLAAVPARGQESPPPDQGCKTGELCAQENVDDRFQVNRGPVNDPPGNYLQSLMTLGLIAVVVGTYLISALTGRNPLRWLRRPDAGRKSAPGRT